MQITVRYGIESTTRSYDNAPTIAAIKGDHNLKAVLGYGDNVKALINGIELGSDVTIPSGATVVIETACNSKA